MQLNQIPISFFIEIGKEKNYTKIHIEPQKTLNSQSKPGQKEQCWGDWSFHSSKYIIEAQ